MRLATRLLIAGLLVGSLVGNAYLFGQLRAYYAELQATRLHPLGLDFLPHEAPARDGRPRLVLLGDSRAEDWRPGAPLAHLDVVPRGLDTQTSAQVRLRLDEHVLSAEPDVVVLQVGINDLKAVGLFGELRREITDDLRHNLDAIVERLRGAGVRVVLTTIFPVGPIPLARRPFWSDAVSETVLETNAWIRARGAGEPDGLAVLDAWALLADDDGRAHPWASANALHMTPAAYAALDEALAELLDARGWG